MATKFRIHKDDSPELQENRKESKAVGKRCVLGQLQNYVPEMYKEKTNNFILSKKDTLLTDTSGVTGNIKALDIKDRENDKLKKSFLRSPLRDLGNCHRGVGHNLQNESPMSIDTPVSKKQHSKEKKIQHIFKPITQTPEITDSVGVQDDIAHVGSPMSIDISPRHSVGTEQSRVILDDLYGCHIYKEDIYKYLKRIEVEFHPKAYYMRRQPDISYSMRTILVDWLVEVGEEYRLRNETLFMAISYIDRFLSTMAVTKPKLQLLGTSAMFIAAKFEEIYPPEVGEFTYITDDTYSAKQLLRMERLILKVLSFDLSSPTSYTFLMHVSSCVKLPSKIIYLAMYICELTLLEADPYLEFYPSQIASGAIALARHCLDYADIWPSKLYQVTGYSLLQMGQVINHLNETHQRSFTLPQTAIRQKYRRAEYECVSGIPFKKLVLRDSFAA